MATVALSVAFGTLLVILAVARRGARRLFALLERLEVTLGSIPGAVGGPLARVAETLEDPPGLPSDLEVRLEEMRTAIAQGITHVDRVESRISGVVGRARKEFASVGLTHPGVEAEAEQLQLIDGGGSQEERLSPVPPDVGGIESSIPGVSREALLRARGGSLRR